MNHRWVITWMVLLALTAVLGAPTGAQEPPRISLNDVPRMTKEDLKVRLGQADLVVIDTRLPGQLAAREPKIRGAVVENPKEVHNWMTNYPKNKTLVLYCS